MDKVAASGDIKKIIFYNIVPSQIFKCIIYTIPVAIVVFSGSGAVTNMLNALQGTPVIDVLSTIGTILPALRIAMNFKAILSNTGAKAYLYMLLGFILSIYLNLPMVVIGVLAVILALLQKDDNVQAV